MIYSVSENDMNAGRPRFDVGDRVVFRRDIKCAKYWSALRETNIVYNSHTERRLEQLDYVGTISEVTLSGSYRLAENKELGYLFADCWVERLADDAESTSAISTDKLLALIGGV